MEALSLDHKSLSPSKQMMKSNPKRMTQNHHHHHQQHQISGACNVISRQASTIDQKMMMMMMHGGDHHGGVFLNPLPYSLHSSFPGCLSRSRVYGGNPYTPEYGKMSASLPPNYYLHHPPPPPLFPPPRPPLLPLPAVSKPAFLSLPRPRRLHSLSPPAAVKDNNIAKTPCNKRRPKNPISLKQHTKTKGSPFMKKNDVVVSSTKTTPLISVEELSVLSLSPPPSSLPLPKFSVRQPYNKIISCTVEAAAAGEIDDGATDNLCRMLRLR